MCKLKLQVLNQGVETVHCKLNEQFHFVNRVAQDTVEVNRPGKGTRFETLVQQLTQLCC